MGTRLAASWCVSTDRPLLYQPHSDMLGPPSQGVLPGFPLAVTKLGAGTTARGHHPEPLPAESRSPSVAYGRALPGLNALAKLGGTRERCRYGMQRCVRASKIAGNSASTEMRLVGKA